MDEQEDDIYVVGKPQTDWVSTTPSGGEGELSLGQMPEQTGAQAAAQTFKPLTPRRMGQYLEERTLPSFEENRIRTEAQRAQEENAARMRLGSLSAQSEQLGIPAEWAQKALSGLGSAADTATFGLFPYAPAAAAKGLGKLGVSGYERYADMPLVEAKKEAEGRLKAAQTVEPGAALSGQVAGFVGGAKATPAIAPTRGPVVSGALTGAVYGGISSGAQEGSLIDALKGTAIGALGGAALAPVAEKVASGLTRMFTGGRPVVDEAGNLTAEALKIARNAGYSPEEIQILAPELAQVFRERGLTPTAAKEARFREFGVEPKRGMVSGDDTQLAKERALGNYQPQAAQMSQAAETFVGGPQAPLRDSVEAAIQSGSRAASQLQAQIDRAYDRARTLGKTGGFSKESITDVGEKLRTNWASDPNLATLYKNDAATEAAKKLDSILGAPFPSNVPGVGNVVYKNFDMVDQGRRSLNEALTKAKDKTDRAAIRRLIDDFDDHVESSINSGAFSGDPATLQAWKDARKLFSDYQRKYGVRRSGEDAGSLFRAVLENGKTSEEVGNMMFAFANDGSASMKATALTTWRQLNRALGPNSPEMENVKQSFVQQMMTPKEASPKGFADVANQVDKFLKGNAAAFSRKVLTPAERASLARYGVMMREAAKSPDPATNPKLSLAGEAFFASVPPTLSAAAGFLGYLDPAMATVLGTGGAFFSRLGAIRGSESLARRAANAPPVEVARGYTSNVARVAPVMGVQAAPGVEQSVPPVLEDIRQRQRLPEGAQSAIEMIDRGRATNDRELYHRGLEQLRAIGMGDTEEARMRPVTIRPSRATGGRVGVDVEADALVRAAERAKKNFNKTTEPLLNAPDNHIAKALEVANRAI
jgi:hypothetical protein